MYYKYRKSIFLGILIFLTGYTTNLAADYLQKDYVTGRITSSPPQIDGLFNDAAWNVASWDSAFLQREPYDGADPSQKTAFKVLYDDQYIYVAIKAYDSEISKIEERLSRRDDFDGDWVGIAFDSYYDHLTAFSFGVTAAGVKNDFIVTNDNESDDTWNPVWYVETAVVDDGWNAEMKIPLTQIRFADKYEHTWGLQVMRWLFRNEEFIAWQHIPQESSQWVSKFGELKGINGIQPKREVELVPYVMGKTETYLKEEGNPFATGKDYGIEAGIDGKVAITNDITMNFTVNPDFGQVEADPSDVNLTAFETFFEEKRPFFIEGNNIYDYPLTAGNGQLSLDNLFYSRRIGRHPHHNPDLKDNECMKSPDFTRILGALKLSGKTSNGWSVGITESITNKETATIDNEGIRREEEIEPLTNFFNARVQKDIDQGNTIVGGMFTSTHRIIEDSSICYIPHTAYTGGLDFEKYWKDKTYFLGIKGIFSQVHGSRESITELQESSRRYFQRPDASHLKVDTNLNTLSGHGGTIQGGKLSGGHWRYLGWVTWRSPGLELNDQGYLRQADAIQQVAWVQYRIWEPFSIFRRININFNQWSGFDFSGTRTYFGGNVSFNAQFKNHFSFGMGINRDIESINRSELRGGPALKYPGDWNNWIHVSSDERKKVVVEMFSFNNWGDQKSSRFFTIGTEVKYRPVNSLLLSVEPAYRLGNRKMQYVETIELENNNHYIISMLNSEQFSFDFRVNFNITPELSIQYWGQPFLFSGDYQNFKKVTNSMAENYNDRFHQFSENEISYNKEEDIYYIDEAGDGITNYSFDNPNFNFFEFRSNLVLRWEYIPGSTVYLVWSQGRTGDSNYGDFDFNKNMGDLFSVVPNNIFLIKFSYRISI